MDNLYFWGIFVIIAGAVFLVRVSFNFDIPAVKILAGTFVILLGLKIVLGNFSLWPVSSGDNEFFFKSVEIDPAGGLLPGYQVVFSQTTFDLAEMEIPEKITELSINSIFSGSTVYLPADVPVRITVEGVFAGVKMPGRNLPLMGRGDYSSDDFDPGMPHLNIMVNVVFGNIVFMRKY